MAGGGSAISGIMSMINIAAGDSKQRQGEEQRRKAKGLLPPMEDPEMRSQLGYLERKRRAIETGGAYSGAYNKIQRNLANTQSGIMQASGGNVGAALSAMKQANTGANEAFGDIANSQNGDLFNWNNQYGSLLDTIARRKAQLQLTKYNQEMAEAAAKIKKGEERKDAGISDLMGSVGSLGGMMGGGGGSMGGMGGGASSGPSMGVDTLPYTTGNFV